MRYPILKRLLLQIGIVFCLLSIWEILLILSPGSLIPAPSSALFAFLELTRKGILFEDLIDSVRRVLIGFTLAAITGIALGLILGTSSKLRIAFTPLIELLRPIPPIAWIPLAMVVFGLGDGSAYFVIFIGAFYPVLSNTILGVTEVPQDLLDTAKLFGCSGFRQFKKVIWPASLPSIFTGLKVGLGFAWMCVVAAEMIAARSGLGYEIQLNRQMLRLDRVLVGMLIIGLIGFLMNSLLACIEKIIMPWRNSTPLPNATEQSLQALKLNRSEIPNSGMAGAAVQITDVCFAHTSEQSEQTALLQNFTLNINSGEVLCIVGPSGCGKTSLLRLIAGLAKASSGSILVDGKDLPTYQKDLTMVFQNSALFPWLTAEGNVKFALEARNQKQNQNPINPAEYLHIVGLEKRPNHYPSQLSGGQKQRVALARALAYSPRLLLLDEPFASLIVKAKKTFKKSYQL